MRILTLALIGGLGLAFAHPAQARPGAAKIVGQQVQAALRDGRPGGIAVAVRLNGQTHFFNYGLADRSRPVTPDVLFNLGSVGKVFDTALLALADLKGEAGLDDPVARHVPELEQGGDIRRVTLRQLATYTSGLVLPQDHPPWGDRTYTLPEFVDTLNEWKADEGHQPGGQMIYSHAGYLLLHLALERRYARPFDALMRDRLLDPLGLRSTALPISSSDPQANPRGELAPALARRAVQGYADDGTPVGAPGLLQGYYHWLGTGQMHASARDMATFLAANLGELPDQQAIQEAMRRAHRPVLPIGEGIHQALAWEVRRGDVTIVDKYGGLNNASAYVGFIPERKLGIVLLANRGRMPVAEMGRRIMLALARR